MCPTSTLHILSCITLIVIIITLESHIALVVDNMFFIITSVSYSSSSLSSADLVFFLLIFYCSSSFFLVQTSTLPLVHLHFTHSHTSWKTLKVLNYRFCQEAFTHKEEKLKLKKKNGNVISWYCCTQHALHLSAATHSAAQILFYSPHFT